MRLQTRCDRKDNHSNTLPATAMMRKDKSMNAKIILSVQDAIRCYSAVAVLADDPSSNVYSYTNGLPETILVKIREIPDL